MMHILAIGFLAPWLMAAGAAATSIPIVIHLLNKRKFRIVVWAAMEWLLAAQRRNARRLKFQRWLLLAVRCLAILIIAAGIAQLVMQSETFGAIVGEQRGVVIILDDSYSMGYQQGAAGETSTTAFEKAKRLLADYISRLRSGDQVMVIRASTGGPEDSTNSKPTVDHQSVVSQLNGTKVTDAGTDLPGAFDRAGQVLKDLEKSTRVRQLLVLTDLSTSSIRDPERGVGAENKVEGISGEKLKKAAEGARSHATEFRVVDMGQEDQENMAVTGVTAKRPVVVAGSPTELQIRVMNATPRARPDVPVTILLDGVPVQTLKLSRIDAGGMREAAAVVTPSTVGRHLVEARLTGDALQADDVRRLMLNVRKEIPILLVDGNPGDGGRTSFGSLFYLYAAYALPADGKLGSVFAPKSISELELPTTPLTGYDVVVLSDTADPGPAVRENLRHYVEGGGMLILFPGDRTNGQRMNDAMGDTGAKLLPATFGQPVKLEGAEAVSAGRGFAPEGYQKNAVMQIFASAEKEGKQVGFTSVQTTTYLKLGVPADGSSEVVLRYAAADGTPGDAAVVMKRGIGADGKGNQGGTVVVFASTADMAWNDWGAHPSYLPFMHELTFYGMGRGTVGAGAGLTMEVGGRVRLPSDTAGAGSWNGPRETHVSVTSETDREGKAFLSSGALKLSGTYGPEAGDGRPVVAVNVESREADVRHVQLGQMAAALGADVGEIAAHPAMLEMARAASAETGGSMIGPWLVGVALVLFLLETILALMFSTYR